MNSRRLFAAIALVLLGGCLSQEEPTTKLGDESVRVQPHGKVDAFGLPLEIVLNPPPVPKEIRGPSPPIKETPGKGTKKSSRGLLDLGL